MTITKVSTGLIEADAASVNLNIDENTLYIDVTTNRVGIGNTNPSTALDVTGSVKADGLTVDGDAVINDTIPQLQLMESDTTDVNSVLKTTAGQFRIQTINDAANSTTNRFIIDHGTGDISFYDTAGSNAKLFWDASTERLGLGTTTPDTMLELSANNNSAASNNTLRFTDTDTGTETNQQIGKIEFKSNDSSGDGPLVRSYILSGSEDITPSSFISFATNPGGAGNTTDERMRIDSLGNVGIGTSSPSSTFRASINGDGSSVIGGIEFRNAAAGGSTFTIGHASATSPSATLNVVEAANLVFKTSNTEAMRIDSAGRVLINKTSSTGSLNLEAEAPAGFSVGSGFYSATTQSTIEFKDSGTTANYKVRIGSEADDLLMFAGGSERMRIDDSGNVGIGVTPTAPLHVQVDGSGEIARFRNNSLNAVVDVAIVNDSQTWALRVDGASSDSFHIRNAQNSTNPVTIDTSGNVGIGVSPTAKLDINISTNARGYFSSGIGEVGAGNFALQVTDATGVSLKPLGLRAEDIRFATLGGERLRIDDSGDLNLVNSGLTSLNYTTDGSADYARITGGKSGSGTGELQFWTYSGGISKAATIDSSGNLLVGKISSDLTTDGFEVRPTGFVGVRSNGDPLYLNRKSSDGAIASFAKDGTTVGSILSTGGDGIIVQGVAAGSGLMFHNSDALLPAQNGNAIDATIDLGRATPSAFRFKDLHLAGGVVFGTTGGDVTSKTLDDYEEGTWTPAYEAVSGAASYGTQEGSYTKIGNKVMVTGVLQAQRGTLSGTTVISGLPFAVNGNGGGVHINFALNFATDMPNLKGYTSGNQINFRTQATNATTSSPLVPTNLSDTATTHNYMYFTAHYFTAA